MGDRILNARSDFFLTAGKKEDALRALCELFGLPNRPERTLSDALSLTAFEITEDDGGNVTDLILATEHLDDDDLETLQTLAPFVRPGSYVMFLDENARQWAWVFREHPTTHVVEAIEEPVIPILASEHRRLLALEEGLLNRSEEKTSPEIQECDDEECEGP